MGALFRSGDRKRVRSDQIDYDYYAENDEELAPNELALVRPLKDVLPRLELLGFTIERAKSEYMGAVEEMREDGDEDGDADEPPDLMNFEEFCAFVAAHPVEHWTIRSSAALARTAKRKSGEGSPTIPWRDASLLATGNGRIL